ncbi:MAG TPA: RNA polymerase sigma factor [Solirubrobacterales bacterium]|nr:RNA polymerase sigma factor [Solirubrobacterales bacterium]
MREELTMGPGEQTSDEQLLAAARRNPEAFAAFYRRHEDAMLLFFLRRTGNAETAADLTAEVFAAALASAARFRPGKAPAVAWLYAIANHKLASSRRRGRVEERARRRLRMEPLVLSDDSLERVEALADAGRRSEVLERLLAELPPEQHDAVRSRVLEERGYDEIAAELRCSQAVVRQRVSRGLKTLRTELGKESA